MNSKYVRRCKHNIFFILQGNVDLSLGDVNSSLILANNKQYYLNKEYKNTRYSKYNYFVFLLSKFKGRPDKEKIFSFRLKSHL